MRRALLLCALLGCADVVTYPPDHYATVNDEVQARVGDLNATLVRCWDVPDCRRSTLITWTSWDSTVAPAFIIRRKP
jgi:hypothetical protein